MIAEPSMISRIYAKVISINSIQDKLIEIQAGFMGLSVFVPNEKLYSIGQEIDLHIYFYWNQENGPSLYGFNSIISKQVFSLIISCSGVGPKIGLAALSKMEPEEIINNIILGDVKAISKINGIGPKKAELIIASLKNKFSKEFSNLISNSSDSSNIINKIKTLSDILNSLNYTHQEIVAVLDYVKKSDFLIESTVDELLRKSLSFLVKFNQTNIFSSR